MSKRKLFISIIAAILVLATVSCCVVGCVNFKDIFNQSAEEETPSTDNTIKEGDELIVESVDSDVSLLSLAPMASTYYNDQYLSQGIVAEFVGQDPIVKTLKWSVIWADPAAHEGEDISDYLTLHEDEWEELRYEIRCHKGFDGEAVVLATTLDGQYTATATVVYRGLPHYLILDNPTKVMDYSPDWDRSMYILSDGSTTSFDIGLDNTLHDVRVDFMLGAINATAYSGVVFEKVEYDAVGDVVATQYVECPLTVTEYTNSGSISGYYAPFIDTDFADTTIPSFNAYVDGTTFHVDSLVVFGKSTEKTLHESGGKIVCTPIGFIDDKAPYVELQVVEGMNGMCGNVEVLFTVPYQGPIRFLGDYIFF